MLEPTPEHDGEAGADDKRGERRCIVSGEHAPPTGLIRFALSPDGHVTPDLAAKLPGRGAWVKAERAAIDAAARKGWFARAFRRAAAAPADLADAVEAGLERRALDALGLARREGAAAVGFDQALAALRKGAACVVSATDAADGGAGKLCAAAREARALRVFTVEALSGAFGKEGVRHVALSHGRAADRFLFEATRLSGFRPVFAPPREAVERIE
jgi:predicted RNA-binding protein YlxR (DUF448 family)